LLVLAVQNEPLRLNEESTAALAMAGLATQVYAVFAVAVALGGPRTPPGPAKSFSPTACAVKERVAR
jgi:hypothetical protein